MLRPRAKSIQPDPRDAILRSMQESINQSISHVNDIIFDPSCNQSNNQTNSQSRMRRRSSAATYQSVNLASKPSIIQPTLRFHRSLDLTEFEDQSINQSNDQIFSPSTRLLISSTPRNQPSIHQSVSEPTNQSNRLVKMLTNRTTKQSVKLVLMITFLIVSSIYIIYQSVRQSINELIFYLSTGSMFIQAYDYYSADNQCVRNYPDMFNQAINQSINHTTHQSINEPVYRLNSHALEIMDRLACPTKASVNRSNQQTIEPSIDQSTEQTVFVVVDPHHWGMFPFIWDSIFVNNQSINQSETLCDQDHLDNCHRCDDETINELINLSTSRITGLSNSPLHLSINQSIKQSRCYRHLVDQSTHLILINHPVDPRLVPLIDRLLVIEGHFSPSVFESINDAIDQSISQSNNQSIKSIKTGAIMLTSEDCQNSQSSLESINQSINQSNQKSHIHLDFLAMTYGDCYIMDQSINQTADQSIHQTNTQVIHQKNNRSIKQSINLNDRVISWPLGASCEHGFPSSVQMVDEMIDRPINRRSNLLNLMVTYSVEKPTRMQARIVAKSYCQSIDQSKSFTNLFGLSYHQSINQSINQPISSTVTKCVITTNDLLFKAVEKIDSVTGWDLKDLSAVHAPGRTKFLPILLDSVFTLAPAGKNPEQYRIWEAIAAGSIPIIEWPRSSQYTHKNMSFHPAYGPEYRCGEQDVHRVLRLYKAPVLYVHEWSELPQLLDSITIEQAQRMQNELREWWKQIRQQLSNEIMMRFRL